MDRLRLLQSLKQIPPQGPEAQAIRKKCVTGSQASSVLSFPVTEEEHKLWSSYTDQFGLETSPQKHGYIGYRSHYDLWKSRHGYDQFKGNEATEWGNKFERTALMLYELIYGTTIHELGILPDAELEWLFISPDAIAENGFMVEIKCPLYRQIKNSGWMSREYWAQTQLQLRVCNSYNVTNGKNDRFKLHFCQNKFWAYKSAKEYLADPYREHHLLMTQIANHRRTIQMEGPGARAIRTFGLPIKGAIVQLSKIASIHPPANLLSTNEEMVVWAMRTSRAVKVIGRFILTHWFGRFDVDTTPVKPLYWHHDKMTVNTIEEDTHWFESVRDEMKINNATSQIDDFFAPPNPS